MARTNTRPPTLRTHNGAPAKHISPEKQLRRCVLSCFLWEREFYEDGESIAHRISTLIPKVDAATVAELAVYARNKGKLRHVPLMLAMQMVQHPSHRPLVADVLAQVIQRPDELCEALSLYWHGARVPIAAQVKKGLARAFRKFSEYQLAKYNRDNAIKLRDVLFLCHAKPKDAEQAALWKRLVDGQLTTPDTWEVGLSACASIKERVFLWKRLLAEGKLGALALLRNLRNMAQDGVPRKMIAEALRDMNTERVLPFRFIAAARHVPQLEPELGQAMLRCVQDHPKLPGRTVLLVDVSGSMDWSLSDRSDMTRLDAACGLAMLAREVCETVEVYTFSKHTIEVPPRREFALRDAIVQSQPHQNTFLGAAIKNIHRERTLNPGDRLIVFTDEQSDDPVPDPPKGVRGYMLNVASAQNGVGYGPWRHIDGFSESVVDYILASEEEEAS